MTKSVYISLMLVSSLLFMRCSNKEHSIEPANYEGIGVEASIDTNNALIGDWIRLTLKAWGPGDATIVWPGLADTVNKFEIVELTGIDTLNAEDRNLKILTQTITITSFDSGYYNISPFKFALIDGKLTDTLETEKLAVAVNTVEIDTAGEIKDVKAPFDQPFSIEDLKEYLPWILAGMGLVAIVIIVLYFFIFKKKKIRLIPPPPIIPPHERALESLEKLKAKKLWQEGKYKDYYTELTDILRLFIEEQHEIPAMESTSDEILKAIQDIQLSGSLYQNVKELLATADLVKFAKGTPMPEENSRLMDVVISFVNETKKEKQTEEL